MWYGKVRYFDTEKILYRTVTYGILARYEITVRYFGEVRNYGTVYFLKEYSTENNSIPYRSNPLQPPRGGSRKQKLHSSWRMMTITGSFRSSKRIDPQPRRQT